MRKFLRYSWGVFCSLNFMPVWAVEKFEVLPDLPDPLAYAVQSAQAASVSGSTDISTIGAQSIGHEPSLISVVLSLLFVIVLIYLTGIIYAKLNKVSFKALKRQQGELSSLQVSVISTTQLGNNKTLHVVELAGKRMLIGASSGAIQLIKDLGDINHNAEECSHIEIPNIKIPKIEIPKIEIPTINFSKLVTKTHKPIQEVEEVINNESNECVFEDDANVGDNGNSDIIIDSLFSSQQDIIQEENEEMSVSKSEHVVDPDDFTLYKKYLG